MTGARQALKTLLDSLGESSRFASSGALSPVLPGLEVKGVGPIGAPVSVEDAKRLIAKGKQAPYGRGAETILDLKVRMVWQIEPARCVLHNPEWDTHLTAMVEAVIGDFAIHQTVSVELYKLLIYEKGGFFAPHRDSEKIKGMFATLVVCLPSRHEGGALIVEHDGQTRRFDFGGPDSEFKIQYAAFYTDCQHEITPVTAGYRVCLIYNLAIAGKKPQASAPQNAAVIEKAARLLEELFADPARKIDKIALPFVHQYTESGLDPKQLKGADRARADVLFRAAASLDYQCYLALLTHYQSGEPDYSTLNFGPYAYGERRSRRWSDDKIDDSAGEMDEVYEETRSLDHWLNPDGLEQPVGTIQLCEQEILTQEGKEGWSIQKEIHEASGNEGVSMELWYRQ